MVATALGNVSFAPILLELGIGLVILSLLARFANWINISPIPFYLLGGIALTDIEPLGLTEDFIEVGSEIGVILLLFMLGLEYTGSELKGSLRAGIKSGLFDGVVNFLPGLLAGMLLGWTLVASLLLGGVTYISSSGVIAKMMEDLGRFGNRETPAILAIVVMEDLVMAAYLPVIIVLLTGGSLITGLGKLGVALGAAGVALLVALKLGNAITNLISSSSEEVIILSVFGLVLVAAGAAEKVNVSSAVGAFLVGIAVSGPVAQRARIQFSPLRDIFAAFFFLFFGLKVNLGNLPPVLPIAIALAVVTGLTKVVTGWYAAHRLGAGWPGCMRAGTALIARGEFSIVIAGLGVVAGVEKDLGALAAAYVLLMAVAGPIITRYSDSLTEVVSNRWKS